VTPGSNLTVELPSQEIVVARVELTDPLNDIAALSVKESLDPLYAINYTLDSGYWVMASGSPLDLQSTVTFGNIINIDGNRIYSSASLNRGNSGGPLVDNEGFVIGINTGYRAVAQDINWAVGINALCQKLATCKNPEHGLIHPTEWEE
jgi:S1-C subfamily serine protease